LSFFRKAARSARGSATLSYDVSVGEANRHIVLADILKALEITLNIAKGRSSSDRKREQLAKEMAGIHKLLGGIISRGREILQLFHHCDDINSRALSVQLLMKQLTAFESLAQALSSGAVGTVLDLHLPNFHERLTVLVEYKGIRVWFALDQLVGNGESLSSGEWVKELSNKGWIATSERADDDFIRETRQLRTAFPVPMTNITLHHEVHLLASSKMINEGTEILDRLDDVRKNLREFVAGKFKIEDVL